MFIPSIPTIIDVLFMFGYTDTSSMRYAVQQLVYLYTTGIFVIHPCTQPKKEEQRQIEIKKSKGRSRNTSQGRQKDEERDA
jgi:hypothetical protein